MKSKAYVAIPLKETLETDWIGPLRHYIAGIYGNADGYTDEINALHRLRQDVRGSTSDSVGRDIVYRYYGQLELLDLRIPVNEQACRVSFTWCDALSPAAVVASPGSHVGAISQYSLAFEKASLLFNLAAINSHIGADTDDIKVAYASFQAAAGILSYIVENFLHAPSNDLHSDTVKALSKLMLAQAQEAFLNKQLFDTTSSKPAIVSKLAKGTSNLYKLAAESLTAVHTAKAWGDRAWFLLARLKAKYYEAVANEYQSQACEAKDKYGEAIAYLNASVACLQEAVKMPVPTANLALNKNSSSSGPSKTGSSYAEFAALIKLQLEQVKTALATLEKDNDFIYHAHVPAVASLAEVTGVEAAKPTPMNQLYKDNKDLTKIIGRDLFERLIPLAVHEKSSLYSEEKATLLRKEGEVVEIADEEMASALEFLDLPASLHSVKETLQGHSSPLEVPRDVYTWAKNLEGRPDLNSRFPSLDQKRDAIHSTLKQAEALIADEEARWRDAASRYGESWSQQPSLALSSGMTSEIQRAKGHLSSGLASDSKLRQMLPPAERDIAILREGPQSETLASMFKDSAREPAAGSHQAPAINLLDLDESETPDTNSRISDLVSHAEGLLDKLRKVSKDRKAVFAEFKDKVHKDDISSLLVFNGKVPNIEEKLFKQELEKFQPYQNRLEATVLHQETLLKELTSVWKQVLAEPAVRQKTQERGSVQSRQDKLTERFLKAYTTYNDVQEGVSNGETFYGNLTTVARDLLENARQFSQNRADERDRLAGSLRSERASLSQQNLRDQLAGLSLNSGSQSNPPPIPPMPHRTSSASEHSFHGSMQHQQPLYQQPQQPQQPVYQQPYTAPSPYDRAPSSYGSAAQWSSLESLGRPASSAPQLPPQLPPKQSYNSPPPAPQAPQGYGFQQPPPQTPPAPYSVPSAYDASLYAPQGQQPPPPQGQQGEGYPYSTPSYSYQHR